MSEFKISRIRYKWKGEWSSGNSYLTDDVVNYGGNVYVCLVGHTAESGGGFYSDLTSVVTNTSPPEPAPRWEKMMEGFQWTGDWSTSIPYNTNDLAKDNGIVYRCITPHTSASSATQGIAPDLASWTIYASTDAWRTDWTPSTKYKLNDIVDTLPIFLENTTNLLTFVIQLLSIHVCFRKFFQDFCLFC